TRATAFLENESEEERELEGLPGYTAPELRLLAASEDVVHLDDLLLRRTSIAFVGGLTETSIRAAADVVAPVLEWDGEHTEFEVARTIAILRDRNRVVAELGGTFIAE